MGFPARKFPGIRRLTGKSVKVVVCVDFCSHSTYKMDTTTGKPVVKYP